MLAAERHYAAEGPWYHLNYWLGIQSAVLAGLAGAAGLSQVTNSGVIAAVISFVVAALALLLTFLQPIRKADTFHRFAKGYEKLYNEIGYFYRVQSKVKGTDMADLLSALDRFTKTFNKLPDYVSSSASEPVRSV